MNNLRIESISSLDIVKLRKILTSEKLTDAQKASFIRKNNIEIKNLVKGKITKQEFAGMMENRPLIRFRPLKNSYTKRGDKILLAKALGIKTSEIEKFIAKVSNNLDSTDIETIEKAKTYAYRHGTKDEIVAFLGYELADQKHILKKLYKTLQYNSGGLADYFSRPIHRMSNNTLAKLYTTIDKSLKAAHRTGAITTEELNSTAEWALIRIYEIQNNSKLINAVKLHKKLK